jgi:uncharacterized membrane protein YfcA
MIKPFVTTYLALVGLWLLFRAFRKVPTNPVPAGVVAPLGAIGGLLDAAGGGGWGPIVTTGLLGAGAPPRYVIGTVNSCEFLVALTVSLSFLAALVTGRWSGADGMATVAAISGLILGGLLAAPLAGWFVKRIKERILLFVVGVLIVLLAGWQTAQQLALF